MRKICFLLIWSLFSCVSAWDSDELEVFDVVEDVKENFYTLLQVPKDANLQAIKKAFRSLSLVLHPDKNDAPDAEQKFRQLVSVYDILRDPAKRAHYDRVLETGLPDWRMPVYYYRRVRRMGLFEMIIILFVIVSIGQYLVSWAAYAEKVYTMQEIMGSKLKKQLKKQKKGKADPQLPPELEFEIPKPSVKNTLPFQVPYFLWFLVIRLPPLCYDALNEWWERRKEEPAESEPEVEIREKPRRKRVYNNPLPEVGKDATLRQAKPVAQPKAPAAKPSVPLIVGGLWTDDDLAELVRLVKKFPPGLPDRWEKISETMRRPVNEITHMAKKLKEGNYQINSTKEDVELEPEAPKKTKTRGGKMGNDELPNGTVENWSQTQQKALENAMAKYPKGGVGDRWEKISNAVPGKSKEECLLRYKHLVEIVKKKKQMEEEEKQQGEQPVNSLSNSEDVTEENCSQIPEINEIS
nr:PREDICTED: dnaJ homolog subfamily C member 1 [Bemisia tabaci]